MPENLELATQAEQARHARDILGTLPIGSQKTMSKLTEDSALCGIPDNTCKIPISDKYSLCLELELKTKTKLHGQQVNKSRDNPWHIAQTIYEAKAIIDAFREDAALLKKVLDK